MKKTNKRALLLSTERVRNLQPDMLLGVSGGLVVPPNNPNSACALNGAATNCDWTNGNCGSSQNVPRCQGSQQAQ